MSDELTEWGKSDDAASYWMAECHALIGQVDETLTWVANAARLGWITIRGCRSTTPYWKTSVMTRVIRSSWSR